MANPKAGPNSAAPTTAAVVGGVYNVITPVLVDGQAAALQVDVNGKLITSGSGGGGGSVNITGVNSNPPALNNPLPVELSDGTQAVGTAGNPLSVNVITGGGSNASVGVTGATAPTSATEIGVIDGTGKLQGASASNPVRVDPVGTTTQPISAASLPLPALAATSTKQSDGSQKTQVVDGSGNVISSTGNALDVNIKTIAATQTVQGNKSNNSVAPGSTNLGVLPALANAAAPTQVEGDQVLLSEDLAGNTRVILPATQITTLTPPTAASIASAIVANPPTTFNGVVVGNKTNNNAAPGATNVGALTAIANAATQTWTEGDLVALSVDLAGALRQNTAEWGGTAVSAPPATGVQPTGAEVSPVVKVLLRKNQDLLSTATIGSSATFTSAVFDTQTGGGAIQAVVGFLIPSSGFGSNALKFDTTDDSTFTVFATQNITPTANVFQQVYVNVTGRYWRLRFVNGATAQTNPILSVVTEASARTLAPAMGGSINDGLLSTINVQGISDNIGGGTLNNVNGTNLAVASAQMAATGNPLGAAAVFTAIRTPNIFKTAQATASGTTTLWTPTAGKKFRLMRFMVQVTGNATTSGGAVITVSFLDQAAATNIAMDVFIPATAFSTGDDFIGPWVDLGNGLLSAVANNVLFVNLSAALTGGNVRVFCCGTEE